MLQMRITACFYKTDNGIEPVRDWLLDLSKEDRKKIGTDIKSVELNWPIGMPVVKPLKNKLWEIRTHLSDGRISRVFFTIKGSSLVLLHSIVKKTQKTPKQDLELARKRAKS